MRYFVTLDDREFSFGLHGAISAGKTALLPDASEAPPLVAEVLSRGGAGRTAVVVVAGQVFRICTDAARPGETKASIKGRSAGHVWVNGRAVRVAIETELERRAAPLHAKGPSQGARVSAPMPGRVVKVNVRVGDEVVAGAALLSIEAMKMENELHAPCAGRVVRIDVQAGATVEAEQELLCIEHV